MKTACIDCGKLIEENDESQAVTDQEGTVRCPPCFLTDGDEFLNWCDSYINT